MSYSCVVFWVFWHFLFQLYKKNVFMEKVSLEHFIQVSVDSIFERAQVMLWNKEYREFRKDFLIFQFIALVAHDTVIRWKIYFYCFTTGRWFTKRMKVPKKTPKIKKNYINFKSKMKSFFDFKDNNYLKTLWFYIVLSAIVSLYHIFWYNSHNFA